MLRVMAIETELAAPTLLIAVPQIGDPSFVRGVVFILEHGDQGSMGLIINKASSLPMGAFCASQNMEYRGDTSALVHQGGPVQTDRAFILHASGHEGPETEIITDDIRLSYSLESLKILADDPPKHLRVFLGYAGWGPGQLADEVSGGAWLLSPPNEHLVFETEATRMWETALREIGIEPVQLMHSGALH
jgi:putative transcriptional regulator